MRGLELRKGSVDLVVNDLSPDLVHSLAKAAAICGRRPAPGTDYAYIGLNLRDPVLADRRVRQAIGYAIDRTAIVSYLRRGLARRRPGIVPSMSWAYADDAARSRTTRHRPGRCSTRPAIAIPTATGPRRGFG